MSHFSRKSPFQGTLCGKRVPRADRNRHEADCPECQKAHEILINQTRR